MVRKNTIIQLQKEVVQGQREYRLISGGEDGLIMWWNFLYSPVKDSPTDNSMLRFVDLN
jgi:hypothetical protein